MADPDEAAAADGDDPDGAARSVTGRRRPSGLSWPTRSRFRRRVLAIAYVDGIGCDPQGASWRSSDVDLLFIGLEDAVIIGLASVGAVRSTGAAGGSLAAAMAG